LDSVLTQLNTALAGRYAIEREIGHGGMAMVYLAQDVRHHRRVAVKVLRPELAALLGTDRFLREIEIAAQLSHPHILPLHDSGEAAGLLYYVMPFVEGESLRDRIARDGALPVSEAVRLLRDVVDALAYAHEHNVVHRDIKPDNVMIAARHALVTDFGIAKAISDAAGNSSMTTAGVSIGTPAYMAPEQCVAEPHIDHRADLYACGVMAYEILAGQLPFNGSTAQAVLAAHLMEAPVPLQEMRRDVPVALAKIVMRCLEKQPGDRWSTAAELLGQLESLATPTVAVTLPEQRRSRTGTRVAFGAAALAVVAIGGLALRRNARVHWVLEEAIPHIRQLADSGQTGPAYALALKASTILPDDPTLGHLWPLIATRVSLHTEPAGALVSRRDYAAPDTTWEVLGTTPLDSIWFPQGFSRLKIEKQGFRTYLGAGAPQWIPSGPIPLDSGATASVPAGMVWVAGAARFALALPGLDHLEPVPLADYRIDRYEVTNAEFKRFVDSGGYQRRELWVYPFQKDGRPVSWAAAMALFKDKTGRPGPATWEVADYPAGQAQYPVTGVSWYEAAAYARFAGKALPTIYHWTRAAETRAASWIVPASNFAGHGPAPVGSYRGIGPFGTMDMAGNAREWCFNETGGQRYILGGGYNDATYHFTEAFAQPPFDRSPTNGFRLALYDTAASVTRRPVERLVRDFSLERPVSDEVFAIYRRAFDYDSTPLRAVVETSDSSADDWVMQRVSFDAAYGGEREIAYLFLPKHGRPPFQTVVYFPGAIALHSRSSAASLEYDAIDFILKSGRAVLYPVYKSTYERGDGLDSWYANETNRYRDHVIAWAKDFRRAIDYLETRPDIDARRLAYYGRSWGGYLGGLLPALEPRIKTAVLYVAGLELQRGQPDVEPVNFLPRIRMPVLMLNGRYDHFFPVETSQLPMFRLLGTPPDRKRHVIYDGGHFVPRGLLISETLDWLDRYLGAVTR
jgi:dienelactone hydrolase/tRNA A-37 threonylcarbamoyl transferase component Bud32